MKSFKVTFKNGQELQVPNVVRHELKNGLHLLHFNPPNLGKFIPENEASVEELPDNEFKTFDPIMIEPDSKD